MSVPNSFNCWLDAVALLEAILESLEAGKLMLEKVVTATKVALYLMSNTHQYTSQEKAEINAKAEPIAEVYGRGQ